MFYKYKIENLIVIPRIVTIHYLELDKAFSYRGERHDFWEMVYADSEDVGVLAGEKQFTLHRGQAVFHRPNEFHSLFALNKPANVFIASFDCKSEAMRFFTEKVITVPPDLKGILAALLDEARQTFLLCPDRPFITRMQKKPESPPGSLQLIRLYLECFLIRALRRQQDGKRALFLHENEYDSRVLAEVSDCLKKMVYGGFSLADLCRRVGMSKTRLYEFYEKHTGMTMGEHFIKLRLEEAKRLLRRTGRVGETADQLGFSSQGYFVNFFKKHAGVTPKQYLKSVSAAADSITCTAAD